MRFPKDKAGNRFQEEDQDDTGQAGVDLRRAATFRTGTTAHPENGNEAGPERTRRKPSSSITPRVTAVTNGHQPAPPVDNGSTEPSPAILQETAHSSDTREASSSPTGESSVPQDPPKPPVVFSLPDLPVEPGSNEAEIIHQAQESFAGDMASAPDTDITSPAYAEHWKQAAKAHDDYLRLTLGWDRFNRLSALASQQEQAKSGSIK